MTDKSSLSKSSTYEFYATKPPVTKSEPESQVQVECDRQLSQSILEDETGSWWVFVRACYQCLSDG